MKLNKILDSLEEIVRRKCKYAKKIKGTKHYSCEIKAEYFHEKKSDHRNICYCHDMYKNCVTRNYKKVP